MFKRFFGRGTPDKQSETSEEVREKQKAEADLSSTEAMVKIKSTMDDLQKR